MKEWQKRLVEGLSGASRAYLKTRKALHREIHGSTKWVDKDLGLHKPGKKDPDKISSLFKRGVKQRLLVPTSKVRDKFRETNKYRDTKTFNKIRRRRRDKEI